MKLITETVEDVSVLVEAKEGSKTHQISGIFMQGNIKNRNGRVYPTAILEREMRRYDKEYIQTSRSVGELGHPEGPGLNGDRISHIITKMYREGDNFMGEARILSTPMGNILKSFIDEGVKFGVSTRGLGTVKNKGGLNEVQDDFHLVTTDVVLDPSGPSCFVNGIYENAEFIYSAADKSWKTAEALGRISNVVKSREKINEAKALDLFKQFVNSL